MEEIIIRQRDAAKPLTGKAFLLGVASIVLRLALAQIVINLAITLSGVGLLNIAFYLYAIWLLVGFMRRTVASYVYTLKSETLVLERRLGDSTSTVVEIPLSSVVSVRPVYAAERLRTTYRQVTVIDPEARPPVRVRAAFAASLFSAHLARALAGGAAQREAGHVLVYGEAGQRKACVFRPDETMREALAAALPDAYGFDERMTHAKVRTLYARALERAFPALYPYVDPLVKREDVEWAGEELAGRKAKKKDAKKGEKKAGEAAGVSGNSNHDAGDARQDVRRRRREKQE
ncbi:MAG: hypothetical protein Q4F18_04765 [Clostridia bacterium]|nr:hypothetical protein [Clostridia bacterium]